ncbi:MAG: peroxiredoxin family protein [Bryobacteraceae bacterium]
MPDLFLQGVCLQRTYTRCSAVYWMAMGLLAALPAAGATPPNVGEKATDFTLQSVQGRQVKLSELSAKSPVALVVLRGFPGYQCPFCQRQVQDFVQNASAFAAAGVRVVFVYPGPPDKLGPRAEEFLAGKDFPDTFDMLLDPGYAMTNLYGLRWDAPQETSYPSTFLLDYEGKVFYSQVAKLHGGRTSATAILGYFKSVRPSGRR